MNDSQPRLTTRRRTTKTKPLFILVIMAIGFAGFLVFGKLPDNVPQKLEIFSSPTPLPVKTITHYFVPVGNQEMPNNISLKKLKASELVTTNTNADIFPDGFQADVVSQEALDGEIQKGKIAIVSLDETMPSWKVLKLEGVNIWEKDFDKESYPLKYVEKRPGESGDEDELSQKELTTIFAGGEIIPARAVDRLGLNVTDNYTYLFDDLRNEISIADLALAQLENPVLGDPNPCTGCVVFVSDERVVKGLKDMGFDVLAVSGNHMGDGGQAGYKRTAEVLDANKMKYTGMGKGDKELLKPAIFEVNGKKIGVMSADDIAYFYWDSSGESYSTNTFSTINNGQTLVNQERVKKIRDIKTKNEIDYLMMYESWGVEYTNKATAHQQELAHAFIDNGVDMVIASHPHWVQNIEFYKGKPIFYALGNFVFDQTHTLETRQSYALNLNFYKGEFKNFEIIPLQTCGYHQTANNLTGKYLEGAISLEQAKSTPESEGCVYWMPKKLDESSSEYKQILDRVFEYSSF